MRIVLLSALFAAVTAVGPAAAQEERGLSLMERGAQLFLEGILREMEPALEGLENMGPQLRSFAQEMGPALADILEQVKDWSAYHPPEILPNGDIIIRKKAPGEDGAAEPDESIEL